MVVSNEDGKYTVEGNLCKRGEKYAVEEITNPKRILTSTIRIEGSYLNLLPVKTDGAVPKELIMSIMFVLNNIKVKSPVKI